MQNSKIIEHLILMNIMKYFPNVHHHLTYGETKYYHSMPDHRALIEWVKSAKLRPYLDFLSEEQGKELESEILERAKTEYPIRFDGNILFGFRRLFFTAIKK